jgi:hypothetical protein
MNPAGENTLGLNLELELHFFAVEAPPVRLPYYRVKPDIEMGDLWRVNLLEVFPLVGSQPVEMNAEWQQLTYDYDLYRYFAPIVDESTARSRWRILYGYRTAFTNGSGFEEPDDPRADYINGRNLDSPLPLWDKSRVCGGGRPSPAGKMARTWWWNAWTASNTRLRNPGCWSIPGCGSGRCARACITAGPTTSRRAAESRSSRLW